MSSGEPDKFHETPLTGGRGITCGKNGTPLPFTLRANRMRDEIFVDSVNSHSECDNASVLSVSVSIISRQGL